MSDTPRTDAALKWVNDGLGHKFAYVSNFAALCSELERENAALRETLIMAKSYVPPQAVTNEWKTKPVSECRLLDRIESVLGKEAKP